MNPTADFFAQAILDDAGYLCFIWLYFQRSNFRFDLSADFLTGNVDKRCQMRQGNGLAAILVGGDLRDDLCCDVAGRRKAVRTFNQCAGNHRTVLEHIFQVDQIAVMHMLCEVVCVMEVDDSFVLRLDDFFREEETVRDIA